jgi:hypothetical protein
MSNPVSTPKAAWKARWSARRLKGRRENAARYGVELSLPREAFRYQAPTSAMGRLLAMQAERRRRALAWAEIRRRSARIDALWSAFTAEYVEAGYRTGDNAWKYRSVILQEQVWLANGRPLQLLLDNGWMRRDAVTLREAA